MKKLILMRHAKSSWADSTLADFERPLNKRGLDAAPFMGELLRALGYFPDLLISSPAKRAIDTARLAAAAGRFTCPIDTDDRIYEASLSRLNSTVATIDDLAGSVLIVGHNPGMEGFVQYLSGELRPMPTAAVAIFALDIKNWSDIGPKHATLEAIRYPRQEMS